MNGLYRIFIFWSIMTIKAFDEWQLSFG